MRTNTKKILGAVAVAGLVATGGSAFTAGGITNSAAESGDRFVGGTVSQTVTGAVLSAVKYNVTANELDSVRLTFDADANGKQVTLTLPNASYTCGNVADLDAGTEPGDEDYATVCSPTGAKILNSAIGMVNITVTNPLDA